MNQIEKNRTATQKVVASYDGESIEYNGIRYSIQDRITNQEDDLLADNPDINDIDFNIASVFKSLGFNSMIYGYGFKRSLETKQEKIDDFFKTSAQKNRIDYKKLADEIKKINK